MITGVNEFHTPEKLQLKETSKKNLYQLIDKYYQIHSILKDQHRPANIFLDIFIDKANIIEIGGDYIEYIVSLLIDNVWKHSMDDSEVIVQGYVNKKSLYTVNFTNISKPIKTENNIFDLGVKGHSGTKGLGYGLNWITVLIEHYNKLFNNDAEEGEKLSIEHTESIISDDKAKQVFSLQNIIL